MLINALQEQIDALAGRCHCFYHFHPPPFCLLALGG